MLTTPRISSLLAASLLVACSALAQSTATSANTTMGTNPNPPGMMTAPGKMMNSSGSTQHKHMRSHSGSSKASVWHDTTRLEAILTDAQTKVSVDGNSWKTVGNEANALANRIYTHASGNATARSAARDLRTHVRELHSAAMKGDAEGVRTHAGMALPYAYTLADWSAPAPGSKGM